MAGQECSGGAPRPEREDEMNKNKKPRKPLFVTGLAVIAAVGLLYLFGRNGRYVRLD